MKKTLISLITLLPLISQAAPKSYVVAECAQSSKQNMKTQIELDFEGLLRPDGRPYQIDHQEMVIKTYEREDEQSPWKPVKELELYFTSRDEDSVVRQFFMNKKIVLQNAIATNDSSWDMSYNSGSMGMDPPSVISVITTSSKANPSSNSLFVSITTHATAEKMIFNNYLECKQLKADGSPL